MSAYDYYNTVPGPEAYLSGTISALSYAYLSKIIPQFWAVEADVFKANKSNICESIRIRLHEYLDNQIFDIKTVTRVYKLNFDLELIEGDLSTIIQKIIYEPGHQVPNVNNYIDDFFKSVRFYLGEKSNIYRIKGELNEDITDVLSDFYTYVVFDVLFIEYKNHMLMIVFGSDE